eukprot:11858301-Alexandrium_andersonii.AAC.1
MAPVDRAEPSNPDPAPDSEPPRGSCEVGTESQSLQDPPLLPPWRVRCARSDACVEFAVRPEKGPGQWRH